MSISIFLLRPYIQQDDIFRLYKFCKRLNVSILIILLSTGNNHTRQRHQGSIY